MPGAEQTPKFDLMLEGSAAPAALLESVITIRVHQDLEMADCLELRLSNLDLNWTESDALQEGKTLRVEMGYEESGITLAFEGTIVRRDCQFPIRGPALVTVVAYDAEHALKHGRHHKAWLDSKDSDIASQLASEAGLSARVSATSTTHRYVAQHDQTHLEFLRERARRIGYEVRLDRENKELYFGPPETSGSPLTLTWEVDLYSFSPRMTTAGMVSEVSVRGWDMTKKEKILGKSKANETKLKLDGSELGADLAKKAHKPREVLYSDTPLFEEGEAVALAQARLDGLATRYAQATGSCQGNAQIQPGTLLDLQSVGERASGRYYVDRVMHHFQPGLGYSSHFQVHRSAERLAPAAHDPLPKVVPSREEAPREEARFVEFDVRAAPGESVEGWGYTVTLPGGEQRKGTIDETGKIRVEGVRDPGEVTVDIDHPEGHIGPAE